MRRDSLIGSTRIHLLLAYKKSIAYNRGLIYIQQTKGVSKINSYEYKGYIVTMGYQWYATKNGKFICEGSSDAEVEHKIDSLVE